MTRNKNVLNEIKQIMGLTKSNIVEVKKTNTRVAMLEVNDDNLEHKVNEQAKRIEDLEIVLIEQVEKQIKFNKFINLLFIGNTALLISYLTLMIYLIFF